MSKTSNRLKSERGVAVPMAAIAMLVLVGMSTLAIETGHLATTATEVQNAADVAALTGARALFDDEDARSNALAALAANAINGDVVGSEHLKSFEIGNYTDGAGFAANLQPTNAVRAVVSYHLENLLADMLGMPVSLVTKSAVATFQGAGACQPTLPVVIGECLFDQGCTDNACQPFLRMAPSTVDNSAWTGYFGGSGTSDVATYLPQECGGTGTSVEITIGDQVNVTNGDLSPLLRGVQCMIDHDIREVTVGVVPCGSDFVQSLPIVGCATFDIVSVKSSGSPKGITMQGLVRVTQVPGGGPNFGSGPVRLVL